MDEKKAEATELKKKVYTLEIKLNERNTELTDLKERVNTKKEQKKTALKEKIQLLEHKIDSTEQYERQDTIVLSGKALPNE